MIKLNNNQLADAKEIAKRPEVIRARKILIMYHAKDPAYAMFRVKASNQTTEILIRTIARKRLLKETREWLVYWGNDHVKSVIGNAVDDFCAAIERESGLTILK